MAQKDSGRLSPLIIAILVVAAVTAVSVFGAFAQAPAKSAPQKFPQKPDPTTVQRELERVNAEIEQTFRQTLSEAGKIPNDSSHRLQRIRTLGKLLLYDRQLSVERNTACVSCHTPETGFTGPISELNRTTVSYPGSVRNATADPAVSRYGPRKPMSYSYSPYAPILHYNQAQKDLIGGNFWDMRASGWKLQNPASEQAQGPFTDSDEQGFIDPACVVYQVSKSPYRGFFEEIWGPQAFDIKWPADIEQLSKTPGPADAENPQAVKLSPEDRGRVMATYDEIGMSIAANEAGPEVSPFASKFDYALAHPKEKVLSTDELAGWQLFRTKGKCNTCHIDGTSSIQGQISPEKATVSEPLFTDFTSSNIGTPKNLNVPFLYATQPDQYGRVANPQGVNYTDNGVGAFIRGTKGQNPNAEWTKQAAQFDGKFQVPTLRNVDRRPSPDFVKAYGHNGYFKSLKEIVHFYNTRDKFPRCNQGAPGEKVTCWPEPEVKANLNMDIGNLGLSDKEEDQIVAFMKTLTDGYVPVNLRATRDK